MRYCYEFPRPALTVDCVVFGFDGGDLKVLLIKRKNDPYAGEWALPGGFVRMEETIEDAARRELQEETGVQDIYLEQLYTFGEVNRDPRGRVVTVAHYALIKPSEQRLLATTDASHANWFEVRKAPKLAFDHDQILELSLERLRGKLRYRPIGFELLPPQFTLRELQHLYEAAMGRQLDKRNFRKKILAMGILVNLRKRERNVAHRAATLYTFDKAKYDRLAHRGFNFEI